ncbi:aminoglycoside 3-N-acetyltransferase [Halalkalicoccus paucihalophilus]|uniref:Aminoglycoside 3-N-acetyltransferase n=1 Tax=Halalkalicoccus paucihalophilus TaxID=1008153 RepID=A0A151AGD4_9EURY|nr:AAC(3) family N-acetyltransferase [Halalkalicoccus paucihalophilus]KYH26602.1 aminoglycoside 3-N-acetyltransferase [Halalkalicoccus paucihalophilus]
MSERQAIERVGEPNTSASLTAEFRALGIRPGEPLLVHASLSALGWTCGGPQAVCDALYEAVGEAGTVVVPTHTGQYTNPAGWSEPPVPEDWIETVREERPPYRPAVTPTRGVGTVPECLRNYPDAIRSRHPTVSFAACGSEARAIIADHGFDYGLGEESPLARLYERDGKILLLGVGHEKNTSLHLGEYRTAVPNETVRNSAPVVRDGKRVDVEYEDIETRTDDFADCGTDFEREVGLTAGTVGAATAKLMDQREMVDFATEWFEQNR